MKDEELEIYCDAIEREFFRLKGRPGTLSPRDFERAREWFHEGIALDVVLEALPEAFHSQDAGRDGGVQDVNSLGHCEPFVDRALARRTRLQ